MGEMISVRADVQRIAEHIYTAHQNGISQSDAIADAAKKRLEPAMATIEARALAYQQAAKTASLSWTQVLAFDKPADALIGSVRDEMWNLLGRPKRSPLMDEVFPSGIGMYTSGDPSGQPVLMEVLMARIGDASAPQWSAAKRAGWIAAIEAAREPFAAAVKVHLPKAAATMVADAAYRAAVRAGHVGLCNLKRDLKSLGLTETQIHEIIPDASKPKANAGAHKEG